MASPLCRQALDCSLGPSHVPSILTQTGPLMPANDESADPQPEPQPVILLVPLGDGPEMMMYQPRSDTVAEQKRLALPPTS